MKFTSEIQNMNEQFLEYVLNENFSLEFTNEDLN